MRLKFAIFAAAVVVAAAPAVAADFIKPLPPAPVGGWYVRGDIGWKTYGTPSTIFDAPSFGPGYVVPGNGELFDEHMSNAWVIGGGVGYDPAGPHRVDFTLDYETPSHYHGHLDCTLCGPGYSTESADITAWTGLANVYIDLAGHPGWTPYVGGGVGFSVLTTNNVASDNPPATTYAGASHWNFAWALTAGFSHDLTASMKLDINYRYVSLGEARSGVINDGLGDTGFFQYQNIHASEIRIGLRQMF